MVERMRNDLNCTGLVYITLWEMGRTVNLPGAELPAHYWNGRG